MNVTATPSRSTTIPPTPVVRSVTIQGPVGNLEGILNHGSPDAPFAALVCHPHPAGGGTMHNKVVYHAMKVLNDPVWGFDLPVLRFNFRGTGLSQGIHDGQLESDDVLAALSWLENEYSRPVVLAGFSFGAAMAVKARCGQANHRESIRALVALGLPTQAEGRTYQYSSLAHCTIPKLFLSGDLDQYAPAGQLEQVVASASQPKKLLFLHGSDHFFRDQLTVMQRALSGWLKEELK